MKQYVKQLFRVILTRMLQPSTVLGLGGVATIVATSPEPLSPEVAGMSALGVALALIDEKRSDGTSVGSRIAARLLGRSKDAQ